MLTYTGVKYPGKEEYYKNRSAGIHLVQEGTAFHIWQLPEGGKGFVTADFYFDGMPYSSYMICDGYEDDEKMLKKEIRKKIRAAFKGNGWKLGDVSTVVRHYNKKGIILDVWEYTTSVCAFSGNIDIGRLSRQKSGSSKQEISDLI